MPDDYADLKAQVLAAFVGHDYDPDGEPVWAWHIHHGVLYEPLAEPIASRMDWIVAKKPAHEIPVRLARLRPVKGKVPRAYAEAWRVYVEAWMAYNESGKTLVEAGRVYYAEMWRACDEAGKACDEAVKAYKEAQKAHTESLKTYAKAQKAYVEAQEICTGELEVLHRVECPGCPWDGEKLAFPKKGGKE